MEKNLTVANQVYLCYHCGDTVPVDRIDHENRMFCCEGCKIVFEILQQNNLCTYYSLQHSPGISPSSIDSEKYSFLDDESIKKQLLDYSDENISSVTLSLPSIHCSSCIWLLEQLYKLDNGIVGSRVDFLKKLVSLQYRTSKTSLKNIVILLSSIGYEPELRLDSGTKKPENESTRTLYYKIGVAGFCFGNAMLFSFPEYLGVDSSDTFLKPFFSYLNMFLGIPVFFYCGKEYFVSALSGLRRKIINIDVPITSGITILFGRSIYEIISQTGPGFIDSLSGLLFFLLLGKLFQTKTYDRLNFERNYKSYFPLSSTIIKNGIQTTIPVASLTRGHRILIRHGEIIPADSILLHGNAAIDYSFVTGESQPIEKGLGEMIHAGGKQTGSAIELEVMKDVSHSYLSQLWNNVQQSPKEKSRISALSNLVGKYFTMIVFSLAIGVLLYWLPIDMKTAMNAFTGILIVACPCALAISIPFTLGTTLRIFAGNDFYLKNTAIIEYLSKIDTIVFDKTGTITQQQRSSVEFIGTSLSDSEKIGVVSLVSNSAHPISRIIAENISAPKREVERYSEKIAKGISGVVEGKKYKIGSAAYVGVRYTVPSAENESRSYLSIDDEVKGYFATQNVYRSGLKEMIASLGKKISYAVISGDNESEKSRLASIFPNGTDMQFNQSPEDKMQYITSLQEKGKTVLMVGDGLNDFGALRQSNVGIAVSENISSFSPSSDAIISGKSITKLASLIRFASLSMKIVSASFVLAFMYNLIGIYLALQGSLTPIMAAILMPLSSISIVAFTTISTKFMAKQKGLLSWQ